MFHDLCYLGYAFHGGFLSRLEPLSQPGQDSGGVFGLVGVSDDDCHLFFGGVFFYGGGFVATVYMEESSYGGGVWVHPAAVYAQLDEFTLVGCLGAFFLEFG